MGAGGWILLLVVAVCVIALIIIAKKRRAIESSESDRTDFGSSSSANKPVEEKQEQVQPSNQVTIYEYRTAGKKRLCTLCDGENDVSATHCHVCGQQLN